MNLEGARIYNEGVGISEESEAKIRKIVEVIRTLSPSSEVSMRFLRCGNMYEGLLWGKADEVPIGVYNRSASMTHLLNALYKTVKKQTLKIWKVKHALTSTEKRNFQNHEPIAMAS
jgi:hypothetical protein